MYVHTRKILSDKTVAHHSRILTSGHMLLASCLFQIKAYVAAHQRYTHHRLLLDIVCCTCDSVRRIGCVSGTSAH